MQNILTIDVEDWFQVHNLESVTGFERWPECESRIIAETAYLLALLDEFEITATFFVLGWNAKRYPELVRAIHERGHEIGTHGYSHRLVYRQSPAEFERDLVQSLRVIEAITHQPVLLYRAPSWSITEQSDWAFRVLEANGIRYDSSIFPARHAYGGRPSYGHRYPHVMRDFNLIEVPISTVPIFGREVPFSGGGYLRAFPYAFLAHGIRRLNSAGISAVVYIHPWELDADQPRIRLSLRNKFREFKHYCNLAGTEKKLRRMLGEFEFSTIGSVVPDELRAEPALREIAN